MPAPKKHSYVADGFKNRTKGEALFNLTSYFGIGYLGVTAFSVFMSWLLRDSAHVSKFYNGLVEKAAEATKGAKTGEALAGHRSTVDSAMNILALFIGGTVMSVLPVKWLEDNKDKLVKAFDHVFYGKEKSESDPKISAAHRDLEQAPKQTWKSVVGARVLAFVATFSTWFMMGSSKSALAKATGQSIDRFSIHAGRWLDGAIHHKNPDILRSIEQARKAHPHEISRSGATADRIFSRIANYVTQDAFYTLITGGALYVFTRMLAPVFDKELKARIRSEQGQPEEAPTSSPASMAAQAAPAIPRTQLSQAEPAGRLVSEAQPELAV